MPEGSPEVRQVRCPLCGMHAPLEQVEYGPYELQEWLKVLGGKRTLTDEEREVRPYIPGRGHTPGRLQYDQVELTEEVRTLFTQRIRDLEKYVSGSEP